MIASTARKYLLKASDMYTVQIFCEELIKDITSNVYFSWEEKKRYSNDLRTFIEDLNRQTDKKTAAEIDAKVNDIEHKKRLSEIKRKDLNTVSMIAGLFTAVVTVVLALMVSSFFPSAEGYNSFVLYTVLAVICAASSAPARCFCLPRSTLWAAASGPPRKSATPLSWTWTKETTTGSNKTLYDGCNATPL